MASRFPTPFSPGRGLWGRDPFLQLHREVNRLFDDTFRDWGEGDQRSLLAAPRLDVHEEGNSLEVSVELPGVEQLQIRQHLRQCDICQDEHDTLLMTKRMLSGLKMKEPCADLEERILGRLFQEGSVPGTLAGAEHSGARLSLQ